MLDMKLTELLGVKIKQVFHIPGYDCEFRIEYGAPGLEVITKKSGANMWDDAPSFDVSAIIQATPNRLITEPLYTLEQLECMRAFLTLGYRWCARDEWGNLNVSSSKPIRHIKLKMWLTTELDSANIVHSALLSLPITWDDEPMDFRAELGLEIRGGMT